MAYKKDLIGLATKKDLRRMEDRITKKINFVIDHFDGGVGVAFRVLRQIRRYIEVNETGNDPSDFGGPGPDLHPNVV